MTSQIIGYWYSKHTPDFPTPEANPEPWENQDEFLKALKATERRAGAIKYRGWSTCRICGCCNGSVEYVTEKFRWPSGLKHYVEEHNVRLDSEFVDWVLKKA